MPQSMVLTRARLVLPDSVLSGTLHVVDGVIAAIDAAPSDLATADDLDGDFLIPGIVDLHSDNLERQVEPRVHARFPSRSAFVAHDAQCAAAGVTTVFDALCVGDLGYDQGRIDTYRDGLVDGAALAACGGVRADHLLHLRCELPAPDMQALFAVGCAAPSLRLISLMDHTPGYGQYAELTRYRRLRQREGMSEAETNRLIGDQQALRGQWRAPNRGHVAAFAHDRGIVLASHDDRTEAEVEENHRIGIRISEFPVSLEAARAARARGMRVIAGAPNLVRGGSHSGNVAVADLVADGLVDALASDYVPASLIEAAFAGDASGAAIAARVGRVTHGPADLVGLHDRGRIAPGLRADLVQVHLPPGQPGLAVVRRAWRSGARVA